MSLSNARRLGPLQIRVDCVDRRIDKDTCAVSYASCMVKLKSNVGVAQ